MATFREILQRYVNYSYDELLNIGKSNLAALVRSVSKYLEGDQEKTVIAVLMVCNICIGADGNISSKEVRFFNDLLGTKYSSSELSAMVKDFNTREVVEMVDDMADSMTSEEKAALLTVCTCFAAVDETINRDEIALLQKLIEK